MITLAFVLNPGRLDSWFSSLGHSGICEKKRKAHLSKCPLHCLEQIEGIDIISSHIYVHKCFVFIYPYNMWTYMHIYIYIHCDMCIMYGKALKIWLSH